MSEESFKRKLTAILSADVEGYSRLMADDESATVKTLETYREVMCTLIMQHRGRVVDSPGDNLLAEFTSVVDAVQCAVSVQKEFQARNTELPENRRMEFRIGVNLGDVIEEGERIYGDGVNIAARLEALADPGGICVSKTAFDQIESKLPLGYEFMGEQTVKNIPKPVGAYRVLMEPRVTAAERIEKKKSVPLWRKKSVLASGIAVIIVIIALGIWNFYLRGPSIEPASEEPMAYPLPDKPSIAVLPFFNMSGDPEQEYFSDGITEDLITDLSKVSGLFVIASNSSFMYKEKTVNVRQIAEDLGVRFVLEGSVRKVKDRVRITAQLIDAISGANMWADRYDRKIEDIFTVQDDVSRKVVSELAVTLKASEEERLFFRKQTERIEVYDLYLRTRREFLGLQKENLMKTQEMSKRLIELDPNFPGGYAYLSLSLAIGVSFGYSNSPREDLDKALEFGQKAVKIDDSFEFSYIPLVQTYLMKKQHDDALDTALKAVSVQPGGYLGQMWLGFSLHWMGRGEEAVKAVKKAIQLNPKHLSGRDPGPVCFLGFACFTAGRYEESISAMKKAIEHFAPHVNRYAFLAASYSELGREDEAKATAEQLIKSAPDFALSSWKFARMYKNPEDTERLLNALRKAGLPEGDEHQ